MHGPACQPAYQPKNDRIARHILSASIRLQFGSSDTLNSDSLSGNELRPKLTIGMACYDDFDGVYFSVQAIRMFHPEVSSDTEIIVVDNHPDGEQGGQTRAFIEGWVPNGRYVPFTTTVGTAVPRNVVFDAASGESVLCIDAHVLLRPHSLRKLIQFYENNPEAGDLFQGPLLYDNLQVSCTHMEPVWRDEMFGIWATDTELLVEPAGDPPEIMMHGLGCFTCRKESWLGFHPEFSGFGGEEGYIHQKYRNAGRTTRLLSFLGWVHRFPRSHPIRFPCTRYHKIRNYLLGWSEVNLPLQTVIDHFRPITPAEELQAAIRDSGVNLPELVTSQPE